MYGSGPGHGTLGVLPVRPEQVEQAEASVIYPSAGVLKTVQQLKNDHNLGALHFGYFSKYEKRPKEFAANVAKMVSAARLGIAISKPADKVDSIKEALLNMSCQVEIVQITRTASQRNRRSFSPRGAHPKVSNADIARASAAAVAEFDRSGVLCV